ncbi:Dabb family protein, partial [Desulfocurvus sp.]|uniref:Dabb family protein n=1 Tax=Desulfocurvus sp. TaxID=2871698 RepID=UPI0025C0E534
MLKHIVMWRLKDEAEGATRAENARKMQQMLEALLTKIPGVLVLEVGLNVVDGPTASDVCLYSEFPSLEAMQAYQEHPEHQKCVA